MRRGVLVFVAAESASVGPPSTVLRRTCSTLPAGDGLADVPLAVTYSTDWRGLSEIDAGRPCLVLTPPVSVAISNGGPAGLLMPRSRLLHPQLKPVVIRPWRIQQLAAPRGRLSAQSIR